MIFVITETFPASITKYDDTYTVLAGPVVTGTTSVGLANWEEGGVEVGGIEYVPYHSDAIFAANPNSGTPDPGVMKLRVHPSDLSTASTELDTAIPFIRSSQRNGSNSICTANGLLYALCATGTHSFVFFGTVYNLDTLQVVEFQPDGTVLRTFNFPVPATWFSHDGPGYYQYPGEDDTSWPCIAISPDGATLYTTAMRPRPDSGDGYWDQAIFKCDVASGTITALVSDDALFTDIQAFITANWAEEESPGSWDPYGFGGMACFANGDLLIASAYMNFLVRIDSDGNVVQLFIGQDGPAYSTTLPSYSNTGFFYSGCIGLCIDGNKAYSLACEPNYIEVHQDDGAGGYNTIPGNNFVIGWDVSLDPGTNPIVKFPTDWGDFLALDDRGFSIWASEPVGGPASYPRTTSDAAPAVEAVARTVFTGEESDPVLLTVEIPPTPAEPPPTVETPPPPPVPPVINPAEIRTRRRRGPIRQVTDRNVDPWGSDVRVSRPEGVQHPVVKDFGGIAITQGGLEHNLTEEQVEEMFTPTYSPLPTRSRDDG